MTHLEIYPVGSSRDDFLAFVSCAPHVPAVGSYLVLRIKDQGYKKFRVDHVEYWFDTIEPEGVPSAVLEVTPLGDA